MRRSIEGGILREQKPEGGKIPDEHYDKMLDDATKGENGFSESQSGSGGKAAKAEFRAKTSLEKVTALSRSTFSESNLPTESQGYKSTVGFFGGKIKEFLGKMVYDMRGIISTIDRIGDAILRTYDEHTVKDPVKMLFKHPKWFFRFMFSAGTKRYRGRPQEIAANAKRLGLDGEYQNHEYGIEIKHPENFRQGIALQDIYRADLIGNEKLQNMDRFKAVSAAASYMESLHNSRGGIGEALPSDFIFIGESGDELNKTVLNIPDIVYNEDKKTGELGKKSTDLLDLLMSISIEELRRSKDGESAGKAIDAILASYGVNNEDLRVIANTRSYAKRGRLTMQGDEKITEASKVASIIRPVFSMHNKARLQFDKDMTADLRLLIVDRCEKFLEDRKYYEGLKNK